ncbi:hypothetical protein CEXT_250681 [Caerostris extrusa]|uniref:Uncharacterized protein n=1 Tax=Caerostris extrusa TaxID=172846 RepID=A0AAV4NV17_CAEEX|nr:hypothetical protein CEXT_250681 [Caerostris extrusa]
MEKIVRVKTGFYIITHKAIFSGLMKSRTLFKSRLIRELGANDPIFSTEKAGQQKGLPFMPLRQICFILLKRIGKASVQKLLWVIIISNFARHVSGFQSWIINPGAEHYGAMRIRNGFKCPLC